MSENFAHPNAQPFLLEGGEDAVLLIHGFTGSPAHMRTVGEAINGAGFTAKGILLPGHGRTIEEMERSNDREWREACRAAYRELAAKYRRVSVVGLSMGGVLSCLMAEEFEPACLILFAPAMKYLHAQDYLSPVAKHVMKRMIWPEGSHRADFLHEYDIGYAAAPVGKVEDMTRLQREARQNLSKITCPVLVVQSHRDEQVHGSVPEIVTRGVSSPVREICWVDKSSHVCTIGPDREYIYARVIDFLRRYGV